MASVTRKLVALAAIGLVMALGAVEAVVRVIEPREVLREFFEAPDQLLHHRLIPGARGRQKTLEFDAPYAINALGLRSAEISRQKPAGTKRLLMLGDSFTEGVGVSGDETFSAQLGKRLAEDVHTARWQVINAGVASYSPLLEYLYLKNGGLALEPDLVVLNLDLSDIFDDIQYTRLAEFDAQGDPVAVRADPTPPPTSRLAALAVAIKDLIKRHTRTYNFVRRRISGYIDAARRNTDFSGDVRQDKYAMLRPAPDSLDDSAWTATYDYLLRIRRLLDERGTAFVVVVYPYGLQISEKEWHVGRQFWGLTPGRVYSGRPQELIEAFGRKNGIRVVNLTPEFQEAARTSHPLYYEFDGHWNAAGHRVVANGIYEAVRPDLQAQERAGTTSTGS